MRKRIIALILAVMMLLGLTACTKTMTLTCDGCGAKVEVPADSNMTEDWTIYCSDCEAKLGLDKLFE